MGSPHHSKHLDPTRRTHDESPDPERPFILLPTNSDHTKTPSHTTPQANMTRGEGSQCKLHYKGANDDFIVFVDDEAASKTILSAEFDTEDEDEVIKKILTEGTAQTVEIGGRQGATNESMSSMRVK